MGVFLAIHSDTKDRINKYFRSDRLEKYDEALNIEFNHRDIAKSKNGLFAFIHYVRDDVLYSARSQTCCMTNREKLSITLLQGYLWEKSCDNSPIEARQLQKMLGNQTCEEIRDSCNGEYSVIHYDEEKNVLLVFNDRLSVEAVYYYQDKSQTIISNRLRLIREVLQSSNPDIETLNWITAVGIIIGEGTSEKSIIRLPQGASLSIIKGNMSIHENNVFMIDKDFSKALGLSSKSAFSVPFFSKKPKQTIDKALDDAIKECAVNIKTCFEKVPKTAIPLSGGKDSRAVLALANYYGIKSNLNIFTNGFDEHPDVIVAKQIADYYQLDLKVRTPRPPAEVDDKWVFNKMMGHVFQSDGMLGAWDAKGYTKPGGGMGLTGHVGEVYRSNYNKNKRADLSNIKTVSRLFHSINLFDRAELLKISARKLYEKKLQKRVEFYLDNGAALNDVPDLFYSMERVPNWVAVLRRNDGYSSRHINPLNTEAFVKLAYSLGADQRKIERIHFEIINRISPWLASQRFADDRWDEALNKYTNGTILATDMQKTPLNLPKFGSWQYKLRDSEGYQKMLLDVFLAYPQSPMWDYCDKSVVKEKFQKGLFATTFELVSAYGFINAFFYTHNIELPMKIETIP